MDDVFADNKVFNNSFFNKKFSIDSITMSSPKLTNRETDNNLRRPSETSNGGAGGEGATWPNNHFRAPYGIGGGALEMLIEPVDEENPYEHKASKWEYRNVSLTRVSGYGFGIAVSGGRDNPHFKHGDPSIVISDVLQGGPASDCLQVNDRIVSANGSNLDNADYSTAVQIMKDSDQLNLIIKRRVPLPVVEFEQKTFKFTLTKSKKKEDFGIVLGCKFYVKAITNQRLAEKEPGVREGDVVLRINDTECDQMSMGDARKLLDKSRERLSLVVQRQVPRGAAWKWSSQSTLYERLGSETPRHSPTPRQSPLVSCRVNGDSVDSESMYGTHNLVRGRYNRHCSTSQPPSRSRTPSQSLFENSMENSWCGALSPKIYESKAAFPKLPGTGEDVSCAGLQSASECSAGHKPPLPAPAFEPRFVSFSKQGGSVGVRVIGGNELGVFVSAVQAGSPAAIKGVRSGDKILRVNDKDMRNVTREEAVLQLLALPDQVDLILQHKREECERVRAHNLGDNFFIRAHFDYEKATGKSELAFKKGDIFQVIDTLYGGTVGSWQAIKVCSNEKLSEEPQLKGVIPNLSKAEQIMASEKQRNGRSGSNGTGTLLRKKMTLSRRSKSLTKEQDEETSLGPVVFPAYENVHLKHPGFLRPVILFGPLADMAREKLLQDFPLRFTVPTSECAVDSSKDETPSPDCSLIRLSYIKEMMKNKKHTLLDVSPASIERLQYAQFCPIIIFLNVDSRNRLRELRRKLSPKSSLATKSTKKLMEDSNKIVKTCKHLFSATLDASQRPDWFDALKELISHLQERRLWMAETKPADLTDDFLLAYGGEFAGGKPTNGPPNDSDYEPPQDIAYSDLYGTLKVRNGKQVQSNGMNNDQAACIRVQAMNGFESENSSNFSQQNSSEGADAPVDQVQSSHDTTPSAQCSTSTAHSSIPQSLIPIATNTLCESFGGCSQVNRNSVCSTNFVQIVSAESRPTSSNNDVFDKVITNGTSPRVSTNTTSNTTALPTPRTYRHFSEPGFFDVKQILDSNVDGYAPQSIKPDNLMAPTSNGSPVSRNRLDAAIGNGFDSPRFTMRKPQDVRLSSNYAHNEPIYSIRPPSIARTPSNHAPGAAPAYTPYTRTGGQQQFAPPMPVVSPNQRPPPPPWAASSAYQPMSFGGSNDTRVPPPPAPSLTRATPTRNSDRTPTKLSVASSENGTALYKDYQPLYSSRALEGNSPQTALAPTVIKRRASANNESHSPFATVCSSPVHRAKNGAQLLSAFQLYAADVEMMARPSPSPRQKRNGERAKSPAPAPEDVLDHVSALVGPEGATLASQSTQVVLKVPPGALMTRQEISFKVFRDAKQELPLDQEKGEKLSSPLLLFGPQGISFVKPVELMLPHDSPHGCQWSLAVKKGGVANSSLSDQSAMRGAGPVADWQRIPLETKRRSSNDCGASVNGKYASILLDKF